MHFALYGQSSGGIAVWTETHTGVAVTSGFFQIELGTTTPLEDSLFDAPLFLGIRIDGEAEMSPRMRIGSVPFARISGGLLACGSGQTNCNGICADLQTDVENCGSCGLSCGVGETCVLGSCGTCTPQTFYRDDDIDGWGRCNDSIQSCTPMGAYTTTQCGDCNDADDGVNPGATEICNDAIDNNCNGLIDCSDFGCPGGGGGGNLVFCASAGSCIDIDNDIQHCSACDLACPGDSQCADVTCQGGSCALDGSPYQGSPCSDQNACTSGDTCSSGFCIGSPITCDDGNSCTVDSCSPASGCSFTPVADGTPCAGGVCNAGQCTP
ncbi:MopE-related protein [Wenzhouxiangella marina]|nr:MopE-related protein [Wenzhouxiangella marina]MBB6088090.1 hypothetical protein [Wenzhouxiangella marina]